MYKKELFQFSVNDRGKDGEHFHQDIELLYILDGAADIVVENKVSHLRTEDIYVINANRKHQLTAQEGTLTLRLMINYPLASESSSTGEAVFWCDSSVADSGKYEHLRKLLRTMLKHYVESRDYTASFGFLGDCYSVLEYLTAHYMLRASDLQRNEDGDRYEERLRQINSYINNNFDQPISMKELSEKLYLSNGYLSRFFKKNYGMSFASYLTRVRIFHAADDLLYTDEPITRIAYNNGFTSAALFNKVFKKQYGQTPSDFRRQSVRRVEEDDRDHQEALERRLEKMMEEGSGSENGEDTGKRVAAGEYAVQFYDAVKNNWGDTINFGDASNLLHSSMREHLMILKQALGFTYVRFWGLFIEDFFIRPEQTEYNFGQIDSVLDFIIELGLRPHIELGIKPRTIHYEPGDTNNTKTVMMDDYSLEEWERLMRAFMRHLSHHYGQDQLDEWRMELWFDESWRSDPQNMDRYLKLFDVTYRAIKSRNENIQVGGYSIRMDVGLEDRRAFLTEWSRRESKPDFLSIMFYAYERREDGVDRYAKRNPDNEALLHLLSREKAMIAETAFSDLPLILNEWNLTPSVRNYINDTTFKGAYIVKNLIDIYGMAEVAAYGAGSDRQHSSFDTPGILFGGMGLLTKDAIMKPAAFAYDFMNQLLPYYIGRSGNYILTTDRHDNYNIVCHNQQVLNYNYYLTPETEMERDAMWKYYEERAKMTVRIKLEGVTEGTYRIKVFRINEMSGSILKYWHDLDFEGELSRNDLKYFRRVCEPNLTIRRAEAHDGDLLIEEEMQPNEIALIKVQYNT